MQAFLSLVLQYDFESDVELLNCKLVLLCWLRFAVEGLPLLIHFWNMSLLCASLKLNKVTVS